MRRAVGVLFVLALLVPAARGQESAPAGFEPLEHLVGGWKGTEVPTADRLRGWVVKHNWAWKFDKGKPVAMNLDFDASKVLRQGTLTFDPKTEQYRLEGTDAAGKPVVYAGKFGPQDKMLALDRVGATPEGKERLTVRLLPENKIRYSLWFDRQEPGAPRFGRVFESGLTKEGESISSAGSAANLPKCIITGGSATMTVSVNGTTFPICCTGCRDEFEANPEKYIKRAALKAAATKDEAKPAPARGKDDGSFDGLLTGSESSAKPKAMPRGSSAPKDQGKGRAKPGPAAGPESKPEPAPEPEAEPAPAKPRADAARAGTLLRLGQALEKAGKAAGALDYYKQIVRDYPDAPQATTAAERIKAIEKK